MGIEKLRVIDTGLDPVVAEREQWDDGNNTLAVAPGVVVAYERNVETNARLEDSGIEVLRIAGSELGSGRGGPRCMSCPLARAALWARQRMSRTLSTGRASTVPLSVTTRGRSMRMGFSVIATQQVLLGCLGEVQLLVERFLLADRFAGPQSRVVEEFAQTVARRWGVEILHDRRFETLFAQECEGVAGRAAARIVVNRCGVCHVSIVPCRKDCRKCLC